MCEKVYDTENDILESIFRNLEYYPSVDVIVSPERIFLITED